MTHLSEGRTHSIEYLRRPEHMAAVKHFEVTVAYRVRGRRASSERIVLPWCVSLRRLGDEHGSARRQSLQGEPLPANMPCVSQRKEIVFQCRQQSGKCFQSKLSRSREQIRTWMQGDLRFHPTQYPVHGLWHPKNGPASPRSSTWQPCCSS